MSYQGVGLERGLDGGFMGVYLCRRFELPKI